MKTRTLKRPAKSSDTMNPISIFVAEDDPRISDKIAEAFRGLANEIHLARSVEDVEAFADRAFALGREHAADLYIIDADLLGDLKTELMTDLRELDMTRTPFIVVVTNDPTVEEAREMRECCGIQMYVPKPITMETLQTIADEIKDLDLWLTVAR